METLEFLKVQKARAAVEKAEADHFEAARSLFFATDGLVAELRRKYKRAEKTLARKKQELAELEA